MYRALKCIAAVLGLCAGLVQQAAATAHALQRPKDMTQHERLELMNRIGARVASPTQWHYRLQPQCVLQATSRHGGAPPQTTQLALRGTRVELGHDAHERRYKVRLAVAQAPQVAATVVFDSPLHTDAMLMKLLLVHVRNDCGGPDRSATGLQLHDGTHGPSLSTSTRAAAWRARHSSAIARQHPGMKLLGQCTGLRPPGAVGGDSHA